MDKKEALKTIKEWKKMSTTEALEMVEELEKIIREIDSECLDFRKFAYKYYGGDAFSKAGH
jgi:hypothetical protein